MKTSRFRFSRAFFRCSLVILASIFFCNKVSAIGGPPGGSGGPVTLGISPMTLLTFSNLTVGESYQMQRTFAWYWTNLPVNFTATNEVYSQMVTGAVRSVDYRLAKIPVPNQAFAVAQIFNGSVTNAIITDGGSGYVTPPTVSIVRGGGTNATAVASISGSGLVTNITITDSGTGYSNTPVIKLSQPPAIAVTPWSQPVKRLKFSSDLTGLGWQLQFATDMKVGWQNVGVMSGPQVDVFVTNNFGFYRLMLAP